MKAAQSSVVEFLLINHPLDCPVCDKGGECPLQDITFGWGRGISRFIEPKRHFVKPLALSPHIAIDRERCILCYRCVRFSQEISEDYQLVLQERGAHSYVSTFDGHPYVAPFSGNIVELCPVGALTSRPYRFRARPWDIEDARLGLHAVPGAVQRHADGARRARAARALRASTPRSTTAGCATAAASPTRSSAGRERVTEPLRARRRRAAPRLLGARAGGGRRRPAPRGRAHRRARRRGGATNEEGLAARAPHARGSRLSRTSTPASRARCRWSCTARSAIPACRRA